MPSAYRISLTQKRAANGSPANRHKVRRTCNWLPIPTGVRPSSFASPAFARFALSHSTFIISPFSYSSTVISIFYYFFILSQQRLSAAKRRYGISVPALFRFPWYHLPVRHFAPSRGPGSLPIRHPSQRLKPSCPRPVKPSYKASGAQSQYAGPRS